MLAQNAECSWTHVNVKSKQKSCWESWAPLCCRSGGCVVCVTVQPLSETFQLYGGFQTQEWHQVWSLWFITLQLWNYIFIALKFDSVTIHIAVENVQVASVMPVMETCVCIHYRTQSERLRSLEMLAFPISGILSVLPGSYTITWWYAEDIS